MQLGEVARMISQNVQVIGPKQAIFAQYYGGMLCFVNNGVLFLWSISFLLQNTGRKACSTKSIGFGAICPFAPTELKANGVSDGRKPMLSAFRSALTAYASGAPSTQKNLL